MKTHTRKSETKSIYFSEADTEALYRFQEYCNRVNIPYNKGFVMAIKEFVNRNGHHSEICKQCKHFYKDMFGVVK